ncbi:MAG: hypothetical protein OER21_07010 [Gemmatimonadota bacterium]|nr:hypothetical protein [Gemmatimonadota bacterium]
MFRTLRAVVVIGLVWALAWLPVGLALALYAASRPAHPGDLLHRPIDAPLFLAV